jgi:hypothetical protein
MVYLTLKNKLMEPTRRKEKYLLKTPPNSRLYQHRVPYYRYQYILKYLYFHTQYCGSGSGI